LKEADRLIETHATILNTHLENKTFVVGDNVTLADLDLAAALSQMPHIKVSYEKYENIISWASNLESDIAACRIIGKNLNNRINKALTTN